MEHGVLSKRVRSGLGWEISGKYLAEFSEISEDIDLRRGVDVEFEVEDHRLRKARRISNPGKPFIRNGKIFYHEHHLINLTSGDVVEGLRALLVANLHPLCAARQSVREFVVANTSALDGFAPEFLAVSPALANCLIHYPELSQNIPDLPPMGCAGCILSLARFASSTMPQLSGSTSYSSLKPEDVFLAAIYGGKPNSLAQLRSSEDWAWSNVEKVLPEGAERRTFTTRSLQPRIAEIEFGRLFQESQAVDGRTLSDLNRNWVSGLDTWRIQDVGFPGTEDWEAGAERFDVKCNVCFQEPRLSGFLIDPRKEIFRGVRIPAFIFWNKTETSCDWSFVGFLNPHGVDVRHYNGNERLSVFFFETTQRVPDWNPRDEDVYSVGEVIGVANEPGADIISSRDVPPQLRIVLAKECGSVADKAIADSLLLAISEVARDFAPGGGELKIGIERLLWEAVNRAFLRLRPLDSKASGNLLALVRQLSHSPWLPIRFAPIGLSGAGASGGSWPSSTARSGIGDSPNVPLVPLLEAWVELVLEPLQGYWSSIRCPSSSCGSHDFSIAGLRLLYEAVVGDFRCMTCGFTKTITLITHCHGCGHFPLIAGRNTLCECGGLQCGEVSPYNRPCRVCKGQPCRCCKCTHAATW